MEKVVVISRVLSAFNKDGQKIFWGEVWKEKEKISKSTILPPSFKTKETILPLGFNEGGDPLIFFSVVFTIDS